MNALHSSKSDRWYTPLTIIESARLVIGRIDLDPASDEYGNTRVQAHKYFDASTDGLKSNWCYSETMINVFCNPPGGREGKHSRAFLFWSKLMNARDCGFLTHAIFVCFSIEALQSTQGKGVLPVAKFPFCIPERRLKFDRPSGVVGKDAPTHSNIIVYVPGAVDKTDLFRRVFSRHGYVVNSCRSGSPGL